MAKLLARLTIAALASAVVVLFLAFGPGPYDRSLAILVAKRDLLARMPSPKLIVLGGSGLLNGLDSGYLARQLGVRVANLGVYAGCGSAFGADYIVPYLNEGDAVVLIPEYRQFEFGLWPEDTACRPWITRSVFPAVPLELYDHPRDAMLDVVALASSKVGGYLGALGIRRKGEAIVDTASFGREFNEYGDKLSGFALAPTLGGRVPLKFDERAIERSNAVLKELARRVAERRAQFRLVPQVIASSWYMSERAAIERLVARLGPVGMLGRTDAYALDDSLFQDTVNHVGAAGRRLRTETLAAALRDDGVFHQRAGAAYSSTGVLSPARYDFTSGFHDDGVFTRGDGRFHRLQYVVPVGQRHLVVNTYGWNPFRNDLRRLGLRVYVDGAELEFARQAGNSYWFALPPETRSVNEVRIVSTTFRPIDLGLNKDGRVLGVDVESVAFR